MTRTATTDALMPGLCRIFLTTVLVAGLQCVCAQDNPSLFTVSGRPVTADEFKYIYEKNNLNKDLKIKRSDIDAYLELFINFKLKVEEARNRGMDTTSSFRQEYETYHQELRRPYLLENKMIDSLVRFTYDHLKEEVRASHILIAVDADASPDDTLTAYNKAMSLKKRALGGEDFNTLAATYSDDPSSRINKGDLGYFTALQMVYPFEAAAYATEKGKVAGPVRTQFGYHLIKVEDRRPAHGEVEVSHIMIRKDPVHTQEEARKTIFDVFDQLRAGAGWDALCTQYSEDPGSKDQGGKLKPFGIRGLSAAPEFEEMAFALEKPGEYSDPFQTVYGWHILKLDRKIPLKPLKDLQSDLRRRVERDTRASMAQSNLNARLEKKYRLRENEEVLNSILNLADSSLQTASWRPVYNQAQNVIFTLQDMNVPASEFIAYVQANERGNRQEPRQYLANLYSAFLENKLMDAQEHELLETNPAYHFTLQEYHEGILLFEIMEEEVWNKATSDTLGQRRYYEQHKDGYRAGERTSLVIYSAQSQEALDTLHNLVLRDTAEVDVYVRSKGIRVESGVFQEEDREILRGRELTPGLFTTEAGGNHYLVLVKERIPAGIRSFQEVRTEVANDYQNEIERQWLEELKGKYRVEVNEKVKRQVYRDLL